MSFFSEQFDKTQETSDKPKRFVLSDDHRSIIDKETEKTALFDNSVLTDDIEDDYAYLNFGFMKVERLIWG
jgi:predicted protein tyrosine phosphatase